MLKINGTVKKVAAGAQGITTVSLASLLAYGIPVMIDTIDQKNDLRVRINNMEIDECAVRDEIYDNLGLKGWRWFEGACERQE